MACATLAETAQRIADMLPAVRRAYVACRSDNIDPFIAVHLNWLDADGTVRDEIRGLALDAPVKIIQPAAYRRKQWATPLLPWDTLCCSDRKLLRSIVNQHTRQMFSLHGNLVCLAGAAWSSDGQIEPVVVAFVLAKGIRPLYDPVFPKWLQSSRQVRLHVVSSDPSHFLVGDILLADKLDKDKLRMPCRIGCRGQAGFGTLGGFLKCRDNKLHLLTSFHVVQKKHDDFYRTLEQPEAAGTDRPVNVLTDDTTHFRPVFANVQVNDCLVGMDVMVAELSDTFSGPMAHWPTLSDAIAKRVRLENQVVVSAVTRDWTLDDVESVGRVLKFGAATGITEGQVWSGVASVLHDRLLFSNQMMIMPVEFNLSFWRPTFCNKGDSGSLAIRCVRTDHEHLKYEAFAQIHSENDSFVFATPLKPILQHIDMSLIVCPDDCSVRTCR